MTSSVTINSGNTLTIDHGVTVKFAAATAMTVSGTLTVNGTSGDHVTFTSNAGTPAAGDWKDVKFNSGSSGTFTYTDIGYGGYCVTSCDNTSVYAAQGSGNTVSMTGGSVHHTGFNIGVRAISGTFTADGTEFDHDITGIKVEGATATITNSNIHDNTTGVNATSGSLTLTNNTFNANSSSAAAIAGLVTLTNSGNVATSASKGWFIMSGNVTANRTWVADLPYNVSSLTVNSGVTLTVDHGAVVKMASAGVMTINGTLNLSGTSGDHVTFTSVKDDSIGGDSNGDGSSSGAAGDWKDIKFNSGSAGTFTYADIGYGGNCTENTTLYVNPGSGKTVSMTAGRVHHSYYNTGARAVSGTFSPDGTEFDHDMTGISVEGGIATVTNSSFHDNLYGVDATTGTLTLTGNTFSANTNAAARIDGAVGLTNSSNVASTASKGWLFMTGNVTANRTWVADLPYYVPSLNVNSGVTLTIDHGAVVKVGLGAQIDVSGTLSVSGTSGDHVIFTSEKDDTLGGDSNGDGSSSAAAGDWKAIKFNSGSSGTLSYADIGYGGYCYTSCINTTLYVNPGSGNTVSMTNGRVHHSGYNTGVRAVTGTFSANGTEFDHDTTGIYVEGGTATITNSSLHDNLFGVDAATGTLTLTGNTFSGNTNAAARVDGAVGITNSGNVASTASKGWLMMSGNVTANRTWAADLPYYVTSLNVNSGVTLTVAHGAVVKVGLGAQIDVSGTLTVSGTSGDHVTFTSEKDDSFGGDSNGDGSSSAAAGDWKAIKFNSGSAGSFSYADIGYGGHCYTSCNNTTLYINPGSGKTVSMTGGRLHHSGYNTGVRVISGTFTTDRTEFDHDGGTGISIEGGAATVDDSWVHDNTSYGIKQSAGTATTLRGTLRYQQYGYYVSGGTVTLTGTYIGDNSVSGVYASSGTVSLSGCTIEHNSGYGVYSSSPSINAQSNYWGAASGPYHPTSNPTGAGDAVSDHVDFSLMDTGSFFVGGSASVDSGEIRWGGSTTYSSAWDNAVAAWNEENPINILPDDIYHIEDLTISDIPDEGLSYYGLYSYSDHTIQFSTFNIGEDALGPAEIISIARHELGHALGLTHSDLGNVMDTTADMFPIIFGPEDLKGYHYLWGY